MFDIRGRFERFSAELVYRVKRGRYELISSMFHAKAEGNKIGFFTELNRGEIYAEE